MYRQDERKRNRGPAENFRPLLPLIHEVLRTGGSNTGAHFPCPFCSSSDALSVQLVDGAFYRCHSCGERGDVFTALEKLEGLTFSEALKRCAELTKQIPNWKSQPALDWKPKEPFRPIPEQTKKAAELFGEALYDTRNGYADQHLAKRRLKREWVIEENAKRPLLACTASGQWRIVARINGEFRSLKAHNENPSHPRYKSYWLLGDGSGKGLANTLWIPPETWPKDRTIYLTEGELKAARFLCHGEAATSSMSGAGFKWPPNEVERMRGRKVVMVYDDDAAGRDYRDLTLEKLSPVCSITPGTY